MDRKGVVGFLAGCFFAVSLLVLSIPIRNCFAGQVTLAWDPVVADTLAGYKLYYGSASRNYTTCIDVGNYTSHTITDLAGDQLFFFAATAYDIDGSQSDYSNEISYATPCTYVIAPTAAKFPSSGGSASVTVTTQNTCSWTATSDISWIQLLSGASGNGNGTVTYSVVPNTASFSRSAGLTVANQSFTVTEAGLPTYTISASATSGGTISPSGSVSVSSGASQRFTLTPAAGHRISQVVVDGRNIGRANVYTFSTVITNHSIRAIFR